VQQEQRQERQEQRLVALQEEQPEVRVVVRVVGVEAQEEVAAQLCLCLRFRSYRQRQLPAT
jgi:hypothetical protein